MTRDERGVGGLEGAAFGVLVFAVGSLVIANAWPVVDAKMAASAAAREAARAFVEAPGADVAPLDAERAGRDAVVGHGRRGEALEVVLLEGAFARCRRIVVEARYPVPIGAVPLLRSMSTTFTVAARHSEIVDPYRSGLAGEATCAA